MGMGDWHNDWRTNVDIEQTEQQTRWGESETGGCHMLLVTRPIIKNLIYWHASRLPLPLSLPDCLSRSTLTFPQVKVYLTAEDDRLPIPTSPTVSPPLLWIEMSDSCYRGNQCRREAGHFWCLPATQLTRLMRGGEGAVQVSDRFGLVWFPVSQCL